MSNRSPANGLEEVAAKHLYRKPGEVAGRALDGFGVCVAGDSAGGILANDGRQDAASGPEVKDPTLRRNVVVELIGKMISERHP